MKNASKKIITAIVVLVIIALFFFISRVDFMSIQDMIVSFIESVGDNMVESALFYVIIYVSLTMVGFSALALTILAGVLFGVWWGVVIAIISATISASIAFFIGKLFSEKVYEWKKNNKGKLSHIFNKISVHTGRHGFISVAILRLLFLPYIPLSLVLGTIKELKFIPYVSATFITNIISTTLLVYSGTGISMIFTNGTTASNFLIIIIPLVIIAVMVSLLPRLVERENNKKRSQ
ncbi:MAG: VTT domain-containing protein [Candidatus Campbellbacteria bacterium]|nr:VTT domain-containing protein [Candidatus Campbellbacteria bacterium]